MFHIRVSTVLISLFLISPSYCQDLNELIEEDYECDDLLVEDDNSTLEYQTELTKSVKFYFLTPDNHSIIINNSNFHLLNYSKPTKFLVHGLGDHNKQKWVDHMASLYHTKGNYNVISFDWTIVSKMDRIYVISVIDDLGNIVGNFLLDITTQRTDYLEQVHLIGKSFGAQLIGVAGKILSEAGKKIGRITGLDPTEPEDLNLLNKTDAEFVDVIHTTVEYGKRKVGDVDFYVTTGVPPRPVCFDDSCGDPIGEQLYIMTIGDVGRYEGVSCYNGSEALAMICDKANGVPMGEHVSKNLTGSYVVTTSGVWGVILSKSLMVAWVAIFVILRKTEKVL